MADEPDFAIDPVHLISTLTTQRDRAVNEATHWQSVARQVIAEVETLRAEVAALGEKPETEGDPA